MLCASGSDGFGVGYKALMATVILAVLLSTAPLPRSDEGQATVPAGEMWSRDIVLEAPAHVTCIVRSSGPVDVSLVSDSSSDSGGVVAAGNATMMFRSTERLGEGQYRLVVVNQGGAEVRIDFQVHQDYMVVANLTAKNVMGLSLALSMAIVALFLIWRPRRPQ